MKIKNLLFTLCFLTIAVVTNGQTFAIDQGAIWVGGMASFTSSGGDLFEYDGDRASTITLAPTVNYFIVPNIFIGGSLEVSNSKQGDYKDTGFGIGPQVGYVIGNESSTSFPFIDAGAKLHTSKSEYGSYDSKTSGTDIFVGAGIVLPVAGHIGFTVEAAYHMMKLKEKDADDSYSGNIFSIGIGITGLLYNPGK
ncbi:MAG: hypothetical protein JXR31_13360 [Prolixibacteraceae bacterium]|nr:hypothetical protein [Prolixibacteraceae bacterium]MBN2775238.1 hypothetical protein [Prolixibacteraceae bacterium]